ncbi:ABC transporter permease [Erysipelothrix sp. HDW6C]|uniref:ABC transporter permease n=1 Tax=Erysipelothrix sp. HDW6C TaxID=2714930 RepID=UPI00140D8FDA|nr:ABC transporter permease [Erysipelothrix sp. HDW6C]QIK69005.1 ABC transporter permease [Erysipelothrix sp. HDW6C]
MRALWIKNWQRFVQRKFVLIMMMSLTLIAILVAVFSTTVTPKVANLVVVGDGVVPHEEAFNITRQDTQPLYSDLVSNRFDAVITFVGESVRVSSLKSVDKVQQIEMTLGKGQPQITLTNGEIGQRIVTYMSVFLLMQGAYMMFLVGDDLQGGQRQRILTSPMRAKQYTVGNISFMFVFITATTMAFLLAMRLFGVNLGYTLITYFLYVSTLTLVGIAFSFLMFVIVKKTDGATMLTQAALILTTLLANASVDQSSLLHSVVSALPQHAIYQPYGVYYGIILSGVFLFIASMLVQRAHNN